MSSEISQGILSLPGRLALHHGGALEGVQVAWRLEGAAQGPVVVALGGISAHRRIYCLDDRRQGWWPELAGPGLPLDASRFRLLGFDFLGGSGETTGPPTGGAALPPISSYDQAALLAALCRHLGIGRLRAIVGASYGGMVALAFAERHPDRVERLLVISAAHRTNPLSTAWRSVEREAVRFGIAEFEQRFAGEPQAEDGRMVFPVERYLFARGDDYARRYSPGAFLCLSESIDLHRIEPEAVRTPTTLVGVTEDQLVTIDDIRECAGRLGGPRRLYEFHSLYGHDAFLKERQQLAPAFAWALDGDS
jgi:homoserine O-acetyltransferase